MFALRDAQGPAEVAFTDRRRDIDGGAVASLDLSSSSVEDARPEAPPAGTEAGSMPVGTGMPEGVDVAVRALIGGDTSAPRVLLMRQVHGAEVAVVDEEQLRRHQAPVADALVTRLPGVVLVVRVADCVPVLLADPSAGVVAAVHAGRSGLVAGVVHQAVRAMRASGASRIQAWVGPHVCGGCYEVPVTMREEVTRAVPEAWAETSWGTPSVDIGAGVLAQLGAHDVAPVRHVPRCTVEDDDLFSYRRQGMAAGRLGGLVWLRP